MIKYLAIMRYRRLSINDVDACVGCQMCMSACSMRFGEGGFSRSAILVRSAGGFERGFIIIVCRGCTDPACRRACPTGALVDRKGGGVFLNSSKCTGCGHCVSACTIRAVMWDDDSNKPIICTHCGYCVPYCPYKIFAMEE